MPFARLWVDQMHLGARKAPDLEVSEVIVFGSSAAQAWILSRV